MPRRARSGAAGEEGTGRSIVSREKKTGGAMENYRERYQQWLDDPYFDEETKKELRSSEGQ